jgi:hypothetical protein
MAYDPNIKVDWSKHLTDMREKYGDEVFMKKMLNVEFETPPTLLWRTENDGFYNVADAPNGAYVIFAEDGRYRVLFASWPIGKTDTVDEAKAVALAHFSRV